MRTKNILFFIETPPPKRVDTGVEIIGPQVIGSPIGE